MKKDLERHNQTVLVIEGHPYSLVREIEPTSNAVCEKCELRSRCIEDDDKHEYWDLCTPDYDNGMWFFIEDWDIIQTPLVCYCTGDHSIAEKVKGPETLED